MADEARFLLLGGDARQTFLAEALKMRFPVGTLGVPALPDTPLEDGAHLVLPCPAFTPQGALRGEKAPPFSAVEARLQPGVTVYCGKPGALAAAMQRRGARVVDLLQDETAAWENARLTAEGALRLALEQGSLLGKACVVIGYGRIGRLLACLLWRMGAQVTVAARKAADRAMAEALGLRAVCPGDGLPETTALVFNTAPAQALPVAELAALEPACVWVELASAPGGLPDTPAFSFRKLDAGGLPGRFFPRDAAQVLCRAILRHLERGT